MIFAALLLLFLMLWFVNINLFVMNDGIFWGTLFLNLGTDRVLQMVIRIAVLWGARQKIRIKVLNRDGAHKDFLRN